MLNEQDQTLMLQITCTLKELCKTFDDDQRSDLGHVILDFIEQIKEQQAAGLMPAQVSASRHQAADQFIEEGKAVSSASKDIGCLAGCSHCCHIAVAITTAEAEELVAVARAKGIVLDKAKLARQAQHDDQTWLSQPAEDRRCVFLGADNHCQVYRQRPFSCRKYFSTAEPVLCNVELHPKLAIPIWFDIWTEALTTAAMTHFGSGHLPQMILGAIQQPTKEDV